MLEIKGCIFNCRLFLSAIFGVQIYYFKTSSEFQGHRYLKKKKKKVPQRFGSSSNRKVCKWRHSLQYFHHPGANFSHTIQGMKRVAQRLN